MVKIGDHYFHVDPTHDDNPRDYDHFLKSDKDIESRDEWHEIWKFEIPNTSRVLHNYPSYMPECKYSVGDANMDGFINKDDLTTIQRYLLGIEDLPGTDTVLADANLDGQIDMSDVVKLIQQYHIY